MKKALKVAGLILIGFVLGFMAAPSDEDDSNQTVQEIETKKDAAKEEAAPPAKEPKKQEAKPVEKAPTQVFEDDRVKISFVKLDTDGVKFLVENKTNVNLTIQADSVAINGFSSNDITMSDDVSPSSKGFVNARTSELADVGTPEKVSGSLRVIDFNDSFESYNASFTDVPIQ